MEDTYQQLEFIDTVNKLFVKMTNHHCYLGVKDITETNVKYLLLLMSQNV